MVLTHRNTQRQVQGALTIPVMVVRGCWHREVSIKVVTLRSLEGFNVARYKKKVDEGNIEGRVARCLQTGLLTDRSHEISPDEEITCVRCEGFQNVMEGI